MSTLLQDVRLGFRLLVKRPRFTVVAVLTLALGIGANTGLFSVINALLVRSLPLEDVDQLVLVGTCGRKGVIDLGPVTYPDFFDWREQNRVFEDMSVFCGAYHNLHTDAGTEHTEGASVSANFFDLLRVKPALGRTFCSGEDAAGAARVAVISDGLWRRHFEADERAVGQVVLLDGEPVEVIGVLPPSFRFPIRAEYSGPLEVLAPEVWTTTAPHAEWFALRDFAPVSAIARLAPGATLPQARTQMDDIARRLEAEYPATNTNRGAFVIPLRERTIANVRPAVMVLSAAVGIVLLIACANVANLFLVRNEERKGDLSVRAALGAGRGALFRHVLIESGTVALAGGALGLLAAFWSIDALVALLPGDLPGRDQVCLDVRVLLFTGAATLIVIGLCGIAPAWRACRCDPGASLKEGRSATAGRTRNRLRSSLVVAEVTMAVVVLIAAGLLTRSFRRLVDVNPGFDTANLLTFRMSRDMAGYSNPKPRAALYGQILERLRAVPGVDAASASTAVPLAGGGVVPRITIVERPEPQPGKTMAAFLHSIDHTYLQTLGTPLLRGRHLAATDQATTPGVTVINETMARYFWPGEDPIGQHISMGRWFSEDEPESFEVVGIVGDVHHRRLDVEPIRAMYIPYTQQTWPFMEFAVRTRGEPGALAEPVRQAVAEVSPDEAPYSFRSMAGIVAESVSERRFAVLLIGFFSALALVLATVGIYGTLQHSVTQRTREIGVRTAFGATAGDIVRLVLRRGLRLTAIGLALGLGLAFGGTRMLTGQLYQTSPFDPLTFIAVPLSFAAVALVACYLPARRATKVDPMVALRCE